MGISLNKNNPIEPASKRPNDNNAKTQEHTDECGDQPNHVPRLP